MIKAKSLELEILLENDRFKEAKLIHRVFILFSIIYLCFGIADYLYLPNRVWEFVTLRLIYCLIPVTIYLFINKTKTFRQTEYVANFHATVASGLITYMIFSSNGVFSAYYAGLNLVGIIALCFFTFSWTFYFITMITVYAPYYILGINNLNSPESLQILLINSFFIFGTVIVCALIHHFRENYRYENISARFQLKKELENRNEIINRKTEEAVNLTTLSSQFSPQVVESIRSGKINLDAGGQRAQICTIFIDIVNSTERVTRIDKDKVEKVLSKFLDDSIKILLKYDITIDKFLGDGILAFCNAPLRREDYVFRVAKAALEIKEKISMDQEFFERHWQKELEIRIGIAKGYANVGFYGSKKYYRSYTAIGQAVNLASRLCTSADPGQILTDYDVFEEIQNTFQIEFVGKKSLKGFENDVLHVYEIKGILNKSSLSPNMNECPNCGSILSLETNAQNQFVFICKSCCTIVEDTSSKSLKVA